jgi:pimeloyl-ACP methyl ester carboxylesterase
VLFLHGLGCTGAFWADVLFEMAGYVRPIVLDLPGFGSSEPLPVPVPVTVPALAGAVRSRLRVLGVTSAVVVGHSLGGMVAQELVSHDPDLVTGLVLCNTIPGASDKVRDINRGLAAMAASSGSAALAKAMLPAMVGPEPLERTEAAVQRFRQQFGDTRPDSLVEAFAAIAAFDMRDRLGLVKQSTLVIGGQFETNLDTQQEMADLLPDATMTVLPGTSHLAPAETPTAFSRVLRGFLTGLEIPCIP